MCFLSKIILTDSNLFFYLYAFLGNPQLLIMTLFCLNNNQRGEIVAYQKVWFAPVEADSSKIIFNFLFLKKIAAFGRMLYVPPFLVGNLSCQISASALSPFSCIHIILPGLISWIANPDNYFTIAKIMCTIMLTIRMTTAINKRIRKTHPKQHDVFTTFSP